MEKPMKCPRCSGTLEPSSLRELSIIYNAHTCTNCHGNWVGPRALDKIEATVDQRWVEVRRIPGADDQQVQLKCPACEGGVSMKKITSRRDSNVVFDQCPTCLHVWLDRGEREAIEQDSFVALVEDFFGRK
jgi:uncharacterized protein